MRTPVLLALGLCLVIVTSCKKESTVAKKAPGQDEKELLDKLKNAGFSTDDIKDVGDYYLVDGDMLFHKYDTDMKLFDKYFGKRRNTSGPQTEQATSQQLISTENVERIVVQPSSGLSSAWDDATLTALQHWANIAPATCKINFDYPGYLSAAYRHIVVVEDPMYDIEAAYGYTFMTSVIAAAEFPTNSNPGFRIRINTRYYISLDNVPQGTKVYNMVHELGHCLGFWHTNGEGSGSVHIAGTPYSDPNSVMNGGTANYTWNGFSQYDVLAANTVYPYGPYDKWITVPEGKYPGNGHYFLLEMDQPISIQWSASLVNTSTVTIDLYQFGSFVRRLATGVPNTGSFSSPIANYLTIGSKSFGCVQVKVTADANSSISDMSGPFNIVVD